MLITLKITKEEIIKVKTNREKHLEKGDWCRYCPIAVRAQALLKDEFTIAISGPFFRIGDNRKHWYETKTYHYTPEQKSKVLAVIRFADNDEESPIQVYEVELDIPDMYLKETQCLTN